MEKTVRVALTPYLQLTQTVRSGDLGAFKQVVETHLEVFRRDQLLTLINRLRHNVIKTGLRNINTSYSRISIADICGKRERTPRNLVVYLFFCCVGCASTLVSSKWMRSNRVAPH